MILFAVVRQDFFLRWKKARQEGGYRAEMTYCRRNFLSRTSLLTLEVNQIIVLCTLKFYENFPLKMSFRFKDVIHHSYYLDETKPSGMLGTDEMHTLSRGRLCLHVSFDMHTLLVYIFVVPAVGEGSPYIH